MLEEGREPPDDFPFIERFRDTNKLRERHPGFSCSRRPWIVTDLVGREFTLQRLQYLPGQGAPLNDVRVDPLAELVALAAGLDGLATHMTDAEHEQPLRGHDTERL